MKLSKFIFETASFFFTLFYFQTFQSDSTNQCIKMKKHLHFYFNKYFLSASGKKKYFLSISFKHKAIWYRVAKVGTRTIKMHLEENADNNLIYSPEGAYIPSLYKDYFKFAFVREPLDRFISAWKDKVLERNYFKFSEAEHTKMKDLDYFISWVETLDIATCDEHIREQSSMIDTEQVDFIGKFENFNEDLSKVLVKLNIPVDEVYHQNRTKKKSVTLTPEQTKKLNEIYKNDFKNFYPDKL